MSPSPSQHAIVEPTDHASSPADSGAPATFDQAMSEVADVGGGTCLLISSTDFWPPDYERFEAALERLQTLGQFVQHGADGSDEATRRVLRAIRAMRNQWLRVRGIEATGEINEAMDVLHGPMAEACTDLLDAVHGWGVDG